MGSKGQTGVPVSRQDMVHHADVPGNGTEVLQGGSTMAEANTPGFGKAFEILVKVHGFGRDRGKARAAALASFDALYFDGNPEISIEKMETWLLETSAGKEHWSCIVHSKVCW